MEIRKRTGPPGAPVSLVGIAVAIFRFPLSAFLIVLFSVSISTGCASPGEPLERKPPAPTAVTDLAAEQSGNDVLLTFTLPKETVDHRALDQAPVIEIYR